MIVVVFRMHPWNIPQLHLHIWKEALQWRCNSKVCLKYAVQNGVDMWIMTSICILHYDHYWYSTCTIHILFTRSNRTCQVKYSNLICSRKKSLSSPLGQLVSIVLEFCSENLWTQHIFSAKVHYLLYKSQNGKDGIWALQSNCCTILHWWSHCSIYGPIAISWLIRMRLHFVDPTLA